MKTAVLVLALLVVSTYAKIGADFTTDECYKSDYVNIKCLKAKKVEFVTLLAWENNTIANHLHECVGHCNKNFKNVDLLVELTPNVDGAHSSHHIVHKIKKTLKKEREHVGRMWFSVGCVDTDDCKCSDNTNCGWHRNNKWGHVRNLAHLTATLSFARLEGFHVGVLSSEYDWCAITGNSTTLSSSLGVSLWYSDEGTADFSDGHHQFGGWGDNQGVVRKRYKLSDNSCGMNVNFDYEADDDSKYDQLQY